MADRFFREAQLADEMAAAAPLQAVSSRPGAVPAILLRASLEKAESQPPVRANQVNLIGCDERFWQLATAGRGDCPGRDEIVLNEPLAQQLGVAVGDCGHPAAAAARGDPGRKPAGPEAARRSAACGSRSATVLPAEGLGRFGLRPAQQLAPQRLRLAGRAAGAARPAGPGQRDPGGRPGEAGQTADGRLSAGLADYGIHVQRTPQGYFNITSDRMLLEPAAEKAMLEALAGTERPARADLPGQHDRLRQAAIPYSTITAIDFAAGPPLGPMLSPRASRCRRWPTTRSR